MHTERLASDHNWSGYLTLDNAAAVTERIRSMIGDEQPYTWVAANEYFGYRPEVRTGQTAKDIGLDTEREVAGEPWAHISVLDSYGVWGFHTTAATQAEARDMDVKQRTLLTFERGKLTVELYAPAGNHMFWVIATEPAGVDR